MRGISQVNHSAGDSATFSTHVVHTIKEYFWAVQHSWRLCALVGTGRETEEQLMLQERTSCHEIKTGTDSAPHPAVTVLEPFEVNISWLLTQLKLPSMAVQCKIDRAATDCHTPRRCAETEAALIHMDQLQTWCLQVVGQFRVGLPWASIEDCPSIDIAAISNPRELFMPVLPLFEDRTAEPPAIEPAVRSTH